MYGGGFASERGGVRTGTGGGSRLGSWEHERGGVRGLGPAHMNGGGFAIGGFTGVSLMKWRKRRGGFAGPQFAGGSRSRFGNWGGFAGGSRSGGFAFGGFANERGGRKFAASGCLFSAGEPRWPETWVHYPIMWCAQLYQHMHQNSD